MRLKYFLINFVHVLSIGLPLLVVFLASPALAHIQLGWFDVDGIDGHFGYPTIVTLALFKVGIGLPPPYGFGAGTEIVSLNGLGVVEGAEFYGLFPLNVYYTPFVNRNERGQPMPAVYAFASVNGWGAWCGSEKLPGHYIKAGAGIEWEVWRGWVEEGIEEPVTTSPRDVLINAIMRLPVTLGIEFGWMGYDYKLSGSLSRRTWASFYVDLKMSYGRHWQRLGR